MNAAHWLILAAFAGFAVLVVLLRWRWPRLRASDAADWQDEPGDPTHEQIEQAIHVVAEQCCDMHNRNCEPPSELCCWECTEIEHPLHRTTDCIAPDLSMPFAEHTDRAMRRLTGAAPLPIHRTEAGYPNCATCDGGGCLDCTEEA